VAIAMEFYSVKLWHDHSQLTGFISQGGFNNFNIGKFIKRSDSIQILIFCGMGSNEKTLPLKAFLASGIVMKPIFEPRSNTCPSSGIMFKKYENSLL
jgi:hypothetical protein